MVWVTGTTMPNWYVNNTFLEDLAFNLAEIHSRVPKNEPKTNMFKIADNLDTSEDFVKDAVNHFKRLSHNYNKNVVLHGDLWNGNIILKPDGRLSGLIDWEHTQIGDPHWEFRMIRRFIGWDGLDYLIKKYNELSVHKIKGVVEVYTLDKLALCHQYQYRLRKNDSRTPLFRKYIDNWPECINDISNQRI